MGRPAHRHSVEVIIPRQLGLDHAQAKRWQDRVVQQSSAATVSHFESAESMCYQGPKKSLDDSCSA